MKKEKLMKMLRKIEGKNKYTEVKQECKKQKKNRL
jgi:hypothetical protein